MFIKCWAYVYKQYSLVTFNVSDNLYIFRKHSYMHIHIGPSNFYKSYRILNRSYYKVVDNFTPCVISDVPKTKEDSRRHDRVLGGAHTCLLKATA